MVLPAWIIAGMTDIHTCPQPDSFVGYNNRVNRHEVGMNIEYRESAPSIEHYFPLFETTGWNREYSVAPDDLAKALAGSQYVVAAWVDGMLVGTGRVVTDGVLHAMLYDVIVHPDYQGRGIGSTLVSMLVQWCCAANIRAIELFCARGRSSFYGKNGFNPRPQNAPGMSYAKQTPTARPRHKVFDRSR
jgi:GNAT superfamily N-acetyltransferase